MLTGIIDYGGGNLRSVTNAVAALGRPWRLVSSPGDTPGLDALIFPGQGSFGDSVRNLQAAGLWDFVAGWVAADRPFLGICLGYQILFDGGEESPGVAGLGVFPGQVVRFQDAPGLKIPHMGWNLVSPTDPTDPLWAGIPADPYFYFVHSYYPAPADPSLAGATTAYGIRFASAIVRGNTVATQFHPEKSQSLGLKLLANFFARAESTLAPSPSANRS
ncbi:imidazole glycerol phosphate synthase subunit HisH [soil metagenome]